MSWDTPLQPDGAKVFTVSELTAGVQLLLEEAFPAVWVAGEISNFKRHTSGHLYLTLKDSQSQLRAVMWRGNALRLRFQPADGLEVLARGHISVYAARGEYQLVVDDLHPKGVGALDLAFRQLKEKLQRLGWFDPELKKPLPRFPQRIAIVTSPTGAAIRDMLRIIPRRWPAADLLVCPVPVQGDGAAEAVATAIRLLNQLAGVDVMIVGRGGGSLEDLWAFNEEIVAEAIFHSRIPVISAVGHETDFTIADFVADQRAATPSEAAELVVPDQLELRKALDAIRQRLTSRLTERAKAARQQLQALAERRVFRKPLQRVRELEQRLDEWAERAHRAMRLYLDRACQRMASQAARLESLSPLNVLKRGYSLTWIATDRTLIRSARQVQTGTRIVTRLGDGLLVSRVEETPSGDARHE
jgi:exodeoxyribonuclease VII large subunit